MNLYSIILLIALLATGCRAPKVATTTHTTTDSTVVKLVETIRYDTVKLPGGVVTVVTTCLPAPNPLKGDSAGGAKPDTTQRGHVRLIISNLGNGMQRIDCEADSLMAVIAGKDREITTLQSSQKQEVKTVVQTVTKYRVPWWMYALAGLWLVWKFRYDIIELVTQVKIPWKK